jgi:hypothetical protein
MKTIQQAKKALLKAWPYIKEECLSVLGSELHYQAMIYHCLRDYGQVPANQIGMNVKMWINDPATPLFKELDDRKHPEFRGGFEPIPDVVLFSPKIKGDWRRRNCNNTLKQMLLAIEVKASERAANRLSPKEIITDIEKLAAHREEAKAQGSYMYPVMMVIDSAPLPEERMTESALSKAEEVAQNNKVGLLYVSPVHEIKALHGI